LSSNNASILAIYIHARRKSSIMLRLIKSFSLLRNFITRQATQNSSPPSSDLIPGHTHQSPLLHSKSSLTTQHAMSSSPCHHIISQITTPPPSSIPTPYPLLHHPAQYQASVPNATPTRDSTGHSSPSRPHLSLEIQCQARQGRPWNSWAHRGRCSSCASCLYSGGDCFFGLFQWKLVLDCWKWWIGGMDGSQL